MGTELHFLVRPFTLEDVDMVTSWWKTWGQPPATLDMLPMDSSYILEVNDRPLYSVTMYTTNSKEFCMIDNLVRNPLYELSGRFEALLALNGFIKEKAKYLGYKKLFCMAPNKELESYYEKLGYAPTIRNVTTMLLPLEKEE